METTKVNIGFLFFLKQKAADIGDFIFFTTRFFRELLRPPYEWGELLQQSYKIGWQSLPLVSVTAFIMGLVLTLQSRPSMSEFGAESLLPGMVAISVIREIGPVITGLICAGKVASRIGAELGSMRVTEQIDAMEVSAINPYKYLVVTRVLASTMMVPLLILYADGISLLASWTAVNIHAHVSLRHFLSLAFSRMDYGDIFPAVIKSFFFGFFIGMIGSYKGFHALQGTASVGRAANSSVVLASLVIFLIDMITVQVTDLLNII